MAITIKLRRAPSSEWNSLNPILNLGEPGYEIDTKKLKIGDGVTVWNNLNYLTGNNNEPAIINLEDIDDEIARLIVGGYGIHINYDDPNNILNISTTGLQPATNILAGNNINVAASGSVFTISASGGTSFEIGNIDLHNGGIQNAQILQFNNNSYQSVITGPSPAENSNAQRLIIQGQKNSGVYEGGDVYLWGGDADTNGGDIKIYAGDADSNESGYGGYVNIDAGNGYNQGGDVSISAGNSSQQAGNVTITAGYSPAISGVVYVRTGGGNKQWTFNNDGALVFPNNSTVSVGTYDNGTGGNGGISLNCTVGYELNWQGGHLKCTQDGGITSSNIILDSPLQFSDNVMICSTSDDLLLKYAAAKLLTPNGNSLSSTNRATLIIMPGVYPLAEQWEIDGEFVDIIGLGSSSLDRGCNVSVTVTDYDINVSANDVKLKGIGTTTDHALKVDDDKPLQVFEECKGGDNSFGSGSGTVSGTFTNCSGGGGSFGGGGPFGGGGTASGTFTNCSGGNYSFGGGFGTASGIFKDCSSGDNSFGGFGTASGTFTNCSGGGSSFGGGGTASGTFTNCSADGYSFGFGGTASGTFTNCSGGIGSFGGWGLASGTFTNCSAGNSGFGGTGMAPGTASGIFTNCSSGDNSFGYGGTASGTFTNCSGGNYSFGFDGTASGTFKDCSGGLHSFGGWGIASGTFTNCSAGDSGFGGTGMAPGTASGTFLRCTLTSGSFPSLTYPGIQRLCIDGSYNVINSDAPTP